MWCFNCGEQGHQRRACLRKNKNEERQEQGTDGREEAGDVGGEREDEAAPPSQCQPEYAETREPPNGMKPPTLQPRLKRLSHEAADLLNSERGTEQSPEPVLEGSLQSQAGGSVPPDMEGEGSGTATGLQAGAVQRSSLSEPQQAEAEAAVTTVAVLGGGEESGAVEVERAAEELAAVDGGADSEDGAEEMEGELSDSSLISDIPDSQPVNRGKKIYTLEEFKQFMESTKGKRGVEIENFFPDLRLFLHSAHIVTRKATLEEFDQQKSTVEESAEKPVPAPRVKKRIAVEKQYVAVIVVVELPHKGKEASGSAGLASSDAMDLPSAESSRPEEDESGAREEDSAEEWEAFAGEDKDEEGELSDTSMLSNTQA
ncbi:UNVERIFIED_CONTAM: hypothetical protein FKN15_026544 [Acipenser sinensis]